MRFLMILLLWTLNVHAIENLKPKDDCEAALSEFRVGQNLVRSLASNQVLIRGELEPFWETGMGDHIAWSVHDDFYSMKVFADPYDALFPLRPLDEMFLLDEKGKILAQGFFGEAIEPGVATIQGKKVQVESNIPLLYKDRSFKELAMKSDDLMTLFHQNASVVVIKTLDERALENMRKNLLPKIDAYAAQQKNPDRFLKVDAKNTVELAYFEKHRTGEMRFEPATAKRQYFDPKTMKGHIEESPGVRIFFSVDGKDVQTTYGDHIFFLDADGKVLGQMLQRSLPIDAESVTKEMGQSLVGTLRRSHQVLVIRNGTF